MSATQRALELLDKRPSTPEAEALRHMFEASGVTVGGVTDYSDLAEDVAARYIIALAVAKGYGEQLDDDLAAALAAAKQGRS